MGYRKLQRSQSARRLILPAFTLLVVVCASLYFRDVLLHPCKRSWPSPNGRTDSSPDNPPMARQSDQLFTSMARPSMGRLSGQSSTQIIKTESPSPRKTFLENVAARASTNKDLIIAYVDSAFVDMALNFHTTSLQRHNITNYLFVSSDLKCCDTLRRSNLPCHVHKLDRSAERASQYGSRDFIRKMNYRTDVILEALENGYTVLHTDTDMVFLKNPFEYLRPLACDIAVMLEKPGLYNAGFVFVRPTRDGVTIYRRMRSEAATHPLMDDQTQLNYAISNLQNTAAVVALPSHLFASGLIYFELPARAFAGDDVTGNNCYVIHNNWIVSKAAKVYRFKEHLMWTLDDGQYYSSTTRRYLVYDNPPVGLSTPPSLAVQLDALRCALAIGQTLNRTVILPSFRCDRNKMCALNSFLRVTAFDEVFRNEYREHVFLRNPMVPKSVKESCSKAFLIRSDAANSTTHHPDELQVLMPNNQRVGADSLEITTWFQDAKESVLSFHCLYGAFSSFINEKQQAGFNTRLEAGFKLAKYRQFR